jgi:hypothetical protein
LPIDEEEWKQGRTWETTESQVELFLKSNTGKAFTQFEIASGLGRMPQIRDLWSFVAGYASLWTIENALQNLIKEGKVKAKVVKKEIGEDTYYMAVTDTSRPILRSGR